MIEPQIHHLPQEANTIKHRHYGIIEGQNIPVLRLRLETAEAA